MIQDINATAIGDFAAAVELFNKVNGTDFDGIRTDTETVAFYPNQIKSAEMGTEKENIGTFSRYNEDIRHAFRGQRAANHEQSVLDRAEQMEKDGADPETIRKETGWFRGMDNKWRFEIDDKDIKLLNVSKGARTLAEAINHKELFNAYPQLAEMPIEFKRIPLTKGGIYSNGKITINSALRLSANETRKTIMHEVQHAIQHIEDFAHGSNEKDAKRRHIFTKESSFAWQAVHDFDIKVRRDYGDALAHRFAELFKYNDDNVRSLQEDKLQQLIDDFRNGKIEVTSGISYRGFRDMLDRYVALNEKLIESEADATRLKNKSAYWKYDRTAGEIESRDVGNRLKYSDTERQKKRPDVDSKNVLFNNVYEVQKKPDVKLSGRSNETKSEIRHSLRQIVGESGKDYGIGVYLDSEVLSELSEDEKIDKVKEKIKALENQIVKIIE